MKKSIRNKYKGQILRQARNNSGARQSSIQLVYPLRQDEPGIVRRLKAEKAILEEVFKLGSHPAEVDFGLDRQNEVWWVLVPNFPLPRGWNRRYTKIMVTVPHFGYPVNPPDGFYLDKNLRDSNSRRPGHYMEERAGYNPFAHKGWAWFCIHIETWRPSQNILEGDSIVTYLGLIRDVLSDVVKRQV